MNRALRTIVVGVGEPDASDPNLPVAIRIASELGARLYAVHAFRPPDPLVSTYPEVIAFDPEVSRAAEQALLRCLEQQVEALGGADVMCRTAPGPPDAVVVGLAEAVNADLIIVGATERGAVSRILLGTTAGRVIRAASVPVLVNRREASAPPRRVLLTTDLSELSGRVHREAAGLAASIGGEGAELRTLLVVGPDLGMPAGLAREVEEAAIRNSLRPFLGEWTPPGVASEPRVRVGDPTQEILAEIDEWKADLLVLGTHGRGGISRLLIGSVAEALSRRAPCDVLVIPAAAHGGAAGTDEQTRERPR